MKTAAKKFISAASLASQQLQLALLAELEAGPSTTQQLAAKMGETFDVTRRALDKLYDASMADNVSDRRHGPDGKVIGSTWVLFGRELPARAEIEMAPRRKSQKPIVIPAPDPLLWAVFGVAVEARP